MQQPSAIFQLSLLPTDTDAVRFVANALCAAIRGSGAACVTRECVLMAAIARLVRRLNRVRQTEAQNIKIEFNHEELYEFYQKLEKIQEQLDNLG